MCKKFIYGLHNVVKLLMCAIRVVCVMSYVFVTALVPVPIFGVKRPRQALLAHPNNYAHDIAEPQPAGVVGYFTFTFMLRINFLLIEALKAKQIGRTVVLL